MTSSGTESGSSLTAEPDGSDVSSEPTSDSSSSSSDSMSASGSSASAASDVATQTSGVATSSTTTTAASGSISEKSTIILGIGILLFLLIAGAASLMLCGKGTAKRVDDEEGVPWLGSLNTCALT